MHLSFLDGPVSLSLPIFGHVPRMWCRHSLHGSKLCSVYMEEAWACLSSDVVKRLN